MKQWFIICQTHNCNWRKHPVNLSRWQGFSGRKEPNLGGWSQEPSLCPGLLPETHHSSYMKSGADWQIHNFSRRFPHISSSMASIQRHMLYMHSLRLSVFTPAICTVQTSVLPCCLQKATEIHPSWPTIPPYPCLPSLHISSPPPLSLWEAAASFSKGTKSQGETEGFLQLYLLTQRADSALMLLLLSLG